MVYSDAVIEDDTNYKSNCDFDLDNEIDPETNLEASASNKYDEEMIQNLIQEEEMLHTVLDQIY